MVKQVGNQGENSINFKNVLETGADLVVGVLTVATAIAVVVKPIFAKFGVPVVLAKIGGVIGLGILSGPVGWAILGGTALFGAAYFGYKAYDAYQDWKSENADRKNSVHTEAGSIAEVTKKEEEQEENQALLDHTIPQNPDAEAARQKAGQVTKYIE